MMEGLLKMDSGEVTRANFSAPARLLKKADEEVIDKVRAETGYKLTRSSLIQILLELAIEAKDSLQTDQVFDQASLKKELKNAFKK